MTQYSREEKAERVENWKGSGKSPQACAKENGLNPQTFTKWVKGKERPGFVEIRHETGAVPESSKIGEAIGYALNVWPALERYVEDWQLTPGNNACEGGIRPFAMGRKNRVMSGSPAGASNRRFASSCELYTLTETAKANGWNPYKYLAKIIAKAAAMKSTDDRRQLLPRNLAP